jgi:AraC family transcriptional regulator, ethanolamine operon transcriptional activator
MTASLTIAGSPEHGLFETRSDDIDDHAATLPGWQQCYDRLGPGQFEGSVSMLRLGAIDLFRETTNVTIRQETMAPASAVVIGLPLPGSDPSCFHGIPIAAGDMIALSGSTATEFLCLGGMDVGAAVIDRDALRMAGFELPEAVTGRFARIVKAPTGESLRSWMTDMLANIRNARLRDCRLHERAPLAAAHRGLVALADAFAEAEQTHRPPLPRRHRTAARARDYVEAHADRLVSVPELAAGLDVSVRTLEQSFAEALGISPAVYLRYVRLNGARRMLRPLEAGDTTVAEVAMAWGFWHLGRFSAYYHSLFGEAPSATLRGPPRGEE